MCFWICLSLDSKVTDWRLISISGAGLATEATEGWNGYKGLDWLQRADCHESVFQGVVWIHLTKLLFKK